MNMTSKTNSNLASDVTETLIARLEKQAALERGWCQSVYDTAKRTREPTEGNRLHAEARTHGAHSERYQDAADHLSALHQERDEWKARATMIHADKHQALIDKLEAAATENTALKAGIQDIEYRIRAASVAGAGKWRTWADQLAALMASPSRQKEQDDEKNENDHKSSGSPKFLREDTEAL